MFWFPSVPYEARSFSKSTLLRAQSMNGSREITQPADTAGKNPQRLPFVKREEPSKRPSNSSKYFSSWL